MLFYLLITVSGLICLPLSMFNPLWSKDSSQRKFNSVFIAWQLCVKQDAKGNKDQFVFSPVTRSTSLVKEI